MRDRSRIEVWIRLGLGAVVGLVATPLILMQIPIWADPSVIPSLIGAGAVFGGLAAYHFHRFRHRHPAVRWGGAGAAAGLLLGAVAFDLGYLPLWAVPGGAFLGGMTGLYALVQLDAL